MNFEQYINDEVIEKNWSILSERYHTCDFTPVRQRVKIISEIIEFEEAVETFKKTCTEEDFEKMCLEMADIALSICTLFRIQDRKYTFTDVKPEASAEILITQILCRSSDFVLSAIYAHAYAIGVDLVSAMNKKMEYNRTRKDW